MLIARLTCFSMLLMAAAGWYPKELYDYQFLILFSFLGFMVIEAGQYVGDRIKESRVA